jgi:hypothetical protein
LAGYQAIRRIVGGGAGVEEDVLLAEQVIRKLLPAAEAVPVGRERAADAGLSQLYFSHIEKP